MSGPSAPPSGGPSPVLIFQTLNAFQRTEAVKAAIELDLFTAVGEGHATAADLARRAGAAERGVRILCDYLTALGFFAKQDGRYQLTGDAATFLDRRSPAYIGGAMRFLLAPHITDAFRDVTAAVRKGGTALGGQGTMDPDHPVWVDFARSMAPMMVPTAERVAERVDAGAARPIKVLDVAAGHGVFGLAFARRNPAAHVVALDWAAVVEVARENARAAGVESRFSTIAGSAFEADLGGPYDVVLLPNFLHHFDPPTCETLLKRIRPTLTGDGRVVVVEFIPDEDRVSPPDAATFALTMLATTPAGDAYTFSEYEQMFRNAGYGRSELVPLDGTPQRAVIARM